MQYELIKCNDKNQWDKFILTSPQNNIFCSTKFLDAWLEDYELHLIKKGEFFLLGAVICMDKSGMPVVPQFMYHSVCFGQLFNNYKYHKRVNKSLEVLDYYLSELVNQFDQISFSLFHTYEDIRSFQWFNYHEPGEGRFKIDINYTGLLDLAGVRDFDNLLMNCRTARRQEYNKCIREGFVIEESKNIEILDILHDKTFIRQDIHRSNKEKFMATKLAKAAIEGGFGRLNICSSKDGNPASASLFLYDEKCGYYLIGASDPDYRKYGTGAYAVLDQIRWCIEQGLSMVDFVGINSPLRGDFKTSFNAMPKPYYSVIWEKP